MDPADLAIREEAFEADGQQPELDEACDVRQFHASPLGEARRIQTFLA